MVSKQQNKYNNTIMTTVMAFYKGTALTVNIGNSITVNELYKLWESQIATGLRAGDSLKELIQLYKGQLDLIEGAWFKSESLFGKNADKRIEYMVKELADVKFGSFIEITALWCQNIACLLKLKIVENNDMNGFMILS